MKVKDVKQIIKQLEENNIDEFEVWVKPMGTPCAEAIGMSLSEVTSNDINHNGKIAFCVFVNGDIF